MANRDRSAPEGSPTPHEQEFQEQESGPGTGWYWIGGFLIFLGLAVGIPMAVYGFMDVLEIGESIERFVAPGEEELLLEEEGTYTIFHEHESKIDGKVYSTAPMDLNGYEFHVYPADDPGRTLDLESGGSSSTYSFGEHSGKSLFTFQVNEPGPYMIQVEPEGNMSEQDGEFVISLGQNVVSDMFKSFGWIMGGCAFLGLLVLLGIVSLVVTFILRS